MRIALDAMGGDYAPGPIVAGAVQAVANDPGLQVLLVGDRAQIEPCLQSAGSSAGQLEIFHCTQAITMEETPVLALRKKPDNSISRCWQLLAERKVEAIVSAGNTGAMVAGGLRLRRFLKNVRTAGHRRGDAELARTGCASGRGCQRQSQADPLVPVRHHG